MEEALNDMEPTAIIRDLSDADIDVIVAIINEAAFAYRGVIPADCWHEPYMTHSDLVSDVAAGVRFVGYEDKGILIGVMGLQKVGDATLIRHAYTRRTHQGHGVGGQLLSWLTARSTGLLLVGTWAAAAGAIRFYEKHGFRRVESEQAKRLLDLYWTIPDRQRETSVVLRR